MLLKIRSFQHVPIDLLSIEQPPSWKLPYFAFIVFFKSVFHSILKQTLCAKNSPLNCAFKLQTTPTTSPVLLSNYTSKFIVLCRNYHNNSSPPPASFILFSVHNCATLKVDSDMESKLRASENLLGNLFKAISFHASSYKFDGTLSENFLLVVSGGIPDLYKNLKTFRPRHFYRKILLLLLYLNSYYGP